MSPRPHRRTRDAQGWKTYWGADIFGDDAAAVGRDRLVQSLGNLSLVNDKLNPTLSNRPWTTVEAQTFWLGAGKRDYLLDHSTLKLNATVGRVRGVGLDIVTRRRGNANCSSKCPAAVGCRRVSVGNAHVSCR